VANALVIGYGNDLRTDDAAGRVVAARIEKQGLPGVDVQSLSQLIPELAEAIAERDIVVFIDADIEVNEVTVRVVNAAAGTAPRTSHYADPASLLALTAAIGTPPDHAYLVSIPVHSMCLGFELTPETAALVDQAVAVTQRLLTTGAPG